MEFSAPFCPAAVGHSRILPLHAGPHTVASSYNYHCGWRKVEDELCSAAMPEFTLFSYMHCRNFSTMCTCVMLRSHQNQAHFCNNLLVRDYLPVICLHFLQRGKYFNFGEKANFSLCSICFFVSFASCHTSHPRRPLKICFLRNHSLSVR